MCILKFFFFSGKMVTLRQKAIIALRDILHEACEHNVDIYITCSCINIPLGGLNFNINVPHLRINQTDQKMCLAWSGNHGQETLDILQQEIQTFVQTNNYNFTPTIYYACPLHVCAQNNLGIHIPGIAVPGQAPNPGQPVNQQVQNQGVED